MNYENDAALGLSATEATRNAKAFEMFGQKFNDLTEIQKQQALLQMVLDAQELSGAMGQAAREADGWENVQGNLNESIRQFQAAAGEPFLAALVPIVQELTDVITNLTQNTDWESFNQGVQSLVTSVKEDGLAGLVDTAAEMGVKFIQTLSDGVANNVPALVETGVNAVLELVTTMVENGLQLLDVGIEFIGNLVQGIIDSIPVVLESSETVLSEFLTNIMDNLPEVLETGVTVVTELVQGIIDSLPEVISSAIELVGTLLKTVLENAPDLIEGGISLVGKLISGIVAAVPDLIAKIPGIVSDMKDEFLGIDWKQVGKDIINAVISGVGNLASNLSKKVGETVSNVKKKFQTVDWKQLGKDIINGIIKGVVSIASQLYEELRSLAQRALDAAAKALGIKSPSRKFRDIIGKQIPAGITVGLEDAFPDTISYLKNQTQKMLDAASNLVPNIMEYSMPVMATGAVLPANAGFSVQSHQLDAIASKLAELAARTGSMEHVINNQSTYQFTAQINRRTLFEEFMEEAKIRQAQTGKNVFDL